MQFLIDNWHLIPFGITVLVVLTSELVLRKKSAMERTEYSVRELAALFATFGIAWITSEYRQEERLEGNVQFFLERIADRADNEYAKEVLTELQQRLDTFKARYAEALTEENVMFQTGMALKKTSRSARFLDHYILVWNSEYESVWQENSEAVRKGIEIQRIFVLSDSLMRDPAQRNIAMRVMERQKRAGVRVSYALQRELQRDTQYQRFADVDYALFDDAVLEKLAARASATALPRYCLVWWDRSKVASENPFPWIQSTGTVRPFDAHALGAN